MRNTALALLVGLGIATAAVAADAEKGPYGAILGTYVLPDDSRDAKYGVGGDIIFLGIPLNDSINLEFNALANTLRRNSDHGTDAQYGGGLDINVPLVDGPVQPFLLAGAGGLYQELATAADRKQFRPFIDAGGGLLVNITKQFAARAQAKWLLDFSDSAIPGKSQLNDFRFSFGVQYSFYTPPPPAKPLPPPVFVPPPPPPPAPPLDSDGDGVPDSIDECPNTPAGVKVDARGCPLDSDGDGVPDYLDQCPGTPKGFKVDAVGCIIEQTVILRTVNFEFNKDTLTTEAKDALDLVAAGLASQPKLTVQIDGHTDSVGSDAYNLKLSKKRAASVRTYLIGKGVDASRLASEGYGESKPIASNETEAGRAENRRVEFQVLNKPLAVKVLKKGVTSTKPRAAVKKKK